MSIFFQNDCSCGKNGEKATPWESAVYEDGYAYGEASTAPLIYRKMWCWGNGRGGRRWQDFLSLPGEEYLEVQAGLAPTQLHIADIAAEGVIDWVQAFTAFEANPETAHQKDYGTAAAYVGDLLAGQIGKNALENALEAARSRSAAHAAVLFSGSGWGALEGALEKRAGHQERPTGTCNTANLSGLSFPDPGLNFCGPVRFPRGCLKPGREVLSVKPGNHCLRQAPAARRIGLRPIIWG